MPLFDISWFTFYTDWNMINPHYFFFRGAIWGAAMIFPLINIKKIWKAILDFVGFN